MSQPINKTIALPKAAFFWESYGPYHFARLNAAQLRFGPENAIGIEIASRSNTYGWLRRSAGTVKLLTLSAGKAAEEVSALTTYRRLSQVIREHDVKVIFTPSYWPLSSFVALIAAKRSGIRVVMMNESHLLSGRNNPLVLAVKRHLLRYFDAALIGGTVHRQFFRQLGMPSERIFDGYDVVDNEYFKSRAAEARANADKVRDQLQLPDRYILSLGRFVKKKNLYRIIEAYAIARRAGKLKGNDLVFVGEGIEKEAMINFARGLGLQVVDHSENTACPKTKFENAVRFYRFAQIDRIPSFYALATCFVLASYVEEWGLVVNEAMASGCPVLVSKLVGCSADLVEPGENGFRFQPQDPDELAFHLGCICSDTTLAHRMGEHSQHLIDRWSLNRFSEGSSGAALLSLTPKTPGSSVDVKGLCDGRIQVVQTCFPDYREVVFDQLRLHLGSRFSLICGNAYFTPGISVCSQYKDWKCATQNRFFFRKQLLWQPDVIGTTRMAAIVVLELNPRILSNWFIILVRALSGRKTLLWGHAWARKGEKAWSNFVRLALMQLSDGVICYTKTQAAQLANILPRKKISVAPNALVPKRECVAVDVALSDLTDVVYLARMIPEKKPRLLLQAFELALRELPEPVRLVFVGDGEELDAMRNAVRKTVLDPRVIFRGHVYDSMAIRETYRRAFCSVSPGYVGLNAVQSFAHGVPMIIADGEPHSPEIEGCREGFNSRFFPSGDAGQLAKMLVNMWQERESWLPRRKEIAQWTAINYCTDAMVAGFVSAIKAADCR